MSKKSCDISCHVLKIQCAYSVCNKSLAYFLFQQTREQWLSVFYISAAIYIVGAIFYLLFASGELQDWARDKESPEVEEMLDKDGVELVDMKRQVNA